jgi:hypothetical protein
MEERHLKKVGDDFINNIECLPCIPGDNKARRLKTTQDPMVR